MRLAVPLLKNHVDTHAKADCNGHALDLLAFELIRNFH